MESFSLLGLAEPLAQALSSFGFLAPTPVQAETIPAILSRRDAIVESETGTGKTFAYLAPAFQLVSILERKGSGEPLAIIAAPTQELAVQIGREAERLAKAASLPAKTVVLLGGTPLEKQAAKLKAKPEIVVGTLGRLADLVSLGKLRTSSLKLLVLDEADRLFARETEDLARALIKSAPSSAVRVLVSATIPERLRREMRPMLRDALEICPAGDTVLSSDIEHWCFYCDGRKRLDFVRRFEAAVHPERCLLFLTMATRVEKSALALAHLGLPVEAIHSGIDKETRRVALERFTKGEVRYLLTSDLGARGLDIAGISHILSLDLPEEPTIYTHRAGRTARAGAKGVSIVLADGVELARASKIATKGGFVFRCKVLEEGQVLEPTSEEFFARVAAFEEQRMAAKIGHVGDGERRGGGKRRSDAEGGPRTSRRGDEAAAGRREGPESRRREEPRPRRSTAAAEGEIEGPRTARKPASAPWRPSSEAGGAAPSKPHNILHKKRDEPKQEKVEENRPAPREAPRARAPAPRGDRPYRGPNGDRPHSAPRGDSPRNSRPYPDRPRSDKAFGAGRRIGERNTHEGDRPGSRSGALSGSRPRPPRPGAPRPKRPPRP
jgi:ATP-dependent RNA helicase DeaD